MPQISFDIDQFCEGHDWVRHSHFANCFSPSRPLDRILFGFHFRFFEYIDNVLIGQMCATFGERKEQQEKRWKWPNQNGCGRTNELWKSDGGSIGWQFWVGKAMGETGKVFNYLVN